MNERGQSLGLLGRVLEKLVCITRVESITSLALFEDLQPQLDKSARLIVSVHFVV